MSEPSGTDALGVRLLSLAGAWLLAALHRTWRADTEGLEQVEALLAAGRRVMVVFWHGGYLPLFPLLRGRGACIFASRSRRGRVLCGICRRFGHDCVSVPEGGGENALALMGAALAGRALAGIAANGPRGPYRVVKRGVCRLAAETGLILIPAAFAARPGLVLTRRWDRMTLPLPFARLCLVFGSPLSVPPDLAGKPVEIWAGRLHDALEAAEKMAKGRIEKRLEA